MKKISALLGVAVLTLSSITGAQAHSSVVKTVPQYQSLLQELPSQVSIQFSEEQIEDEQLIVKIDNSDAVVGTYSVKYRMASADGHVISGSYRFDYKESSKTSPVKVVKDNQWWGSHFLHLHKEHILQALAVLLLGAGWFVLRRRRQSR